ncbi:MAG: cyclodeaminase/cyclohydrolase family protein [Phycisphaerales bacterium]
MSGHGASLVDLPLRTFVHRLASREPVPGGGAVAAVTLAQAAGLAAMVLEYTIGKSRFEAFRADNEAMLGRCRALVEESLRLAEMDAAGYAALNQVLQLPKDHPERAARLGPAAVAASRPPERMLEESVRLLEALPALVGHTTAMLRSDLAMAGILGRAAAESAAWNVRANLPLVAGNQAAARAEGDAAIAAWLGRAAIADESFRAALAAPRDQGLPA